MGIAAHHAVCAVVLAGGMDDGLESGKGDGPEILKSPGGVEQDAGGIVRPQVPDLGVGVRGDPQFIDNGIVQIDDGNIRS